MRQGYTQRECKAAAERCRKRVEIARNRLARNPEGNQERTAALQASLNRAKEEREWVAKVYQA